LFVYGQTGSGKSHTIFGPDGTLDKVSGASSAATSLSSTATAAGDRFHLPSEAGMVLRALQEILDAIANEDLGEGVKASISAQYVQIYQEQLTDLLTGDDVKLRGGSGGNFTLQGAVTTPIDSFGDAVELLQIGEANKRFAATTMNNHSSRAHTVFILNISQVRASTVLVVLF
jgi:kinesin family protein 5